MLESLFNKGAGLKGCNFIKERLQRRCFPVNVAQFLRIAFSWNISAGCFCKSLIIFTEVWVRTLSNIYDGAFCRNSENLSTIFTKNPIPDVWRVPKHASASKRFLKLIYNIYCYLILKVKILRKANFSEYQEMTAPTFLFIKVNYAFTHQNFNPSLLINKTIVKKRKETVSFRFLIRKYRPEKTYNYGQKVVDKFTKLSKIGFSMGCFAADFLWLASENFKNWL